MGTPLHKLIILHVHITHYTLQQVPGVQITAVTVTVPGYPGGTQYTTSHLIFSSSHNVYFISTLEFSNNNILCNTKRNGIQDKPFGVYWFTYSVVNCNEL